MTRRPRYTIGQSGPTRRRDKRNRRRLARGLPPVGTWCCAHLAENAQETSTDTAPRVLP